MAACHNSSLLIGKHGADGQATFRQPCSCFGKRFAKECVIVHAGVVLTCYFNGNQCNISLRAANDLIGGTLSHGVGRIEVEIQFEDVDSRLSQKSELPA